VDDVKVGSAAPAGPGLGSSKRRIVERLKRADATVAELARGLGLTEAAVRQHLDALAEHGLAEPRPRSRAGRGRPPAVWTLTELASDLFPDRHDDLTVDLIDAVRTALGDDGLSHVLDARAARQREEYARAIPRRASMRARVEALARVRSEEGYLAEVVADDRGEVVLVEHHCPIGTAASACSALCASELELFRTVLGPTVRVERTQHLLAGDRRCAYRITRAS
jgi:predicted ArsR family transcriptional regulator